jgi:hypothetical protein
MLAFLHVSVPLARHVTSARSRTSSLRMEAECISETINDGIEVGVKTGPGRTVTLCPCILEIFSSNISRDTGCPGLPPFIQANDVLVPDCVTTAFFQTLYSLTVRYGHFPLFCLPLRKQRFGEWICLLLQVETAELCPRVKDHSVAIRRY